MSEVTVLVDEEEEFDDRGSYNHSLVQGNLTHLIKLHSDYSALVEVSLDTSDLDKSQFPNIKNELIPDVCAYPRRPVAVRDILVMKEMPKFVIEVISPRQGSFSIIEKFQAYFAMGIKSCWLVDPVTTVISVYYPNQPPRTFASGEVVDEIADIKIPLAEAFE
ncbi:MAG: Uma2 family endonuclease [Chloroflexota bacterium]